MLPGYTYVYVSWFVVIGGEWKQVFSDSGSKIVEKMRKVDMLVVIMMFVAVGDGGSGYPQMRTHLQPHLHSGYTSLMAQHILSFISLYSVTATTVGVARMKKESL